MVGHNIQNQAHSRRVHIIGQALQPGSPAHDLADAGVVDDVVAVRRPRGGGQHGGEIDVGDAQVVQIGH